MHRPLLDDEVVGKGDGGRHALHELDDAHGRQHGEERHRVDEAPLESHLPTQRGAHK